MRNKYRVILCVFTGYIPALDLFLTLFFPITFLKEQKQILCVFMVTSLRVYRSKVF